ncbi:hypothetical protein T484DRAFT_1822759 [Baffinella frigidus]|nr:hypothetical protein T484DRAFT_1822759 [Cryptophyta sp. CCMP2293]
MLRIVPLTVHGGHYYAFVRPTCGKDWFKFNDEVVSRVTMEEAVSQNYGTVFDHLMGQKRGVV